MSGDALWFFVLRRIAALAVLLVVISFAVFSLLYAAPGSAEQLLLGNEPATPQTVAAIRHEYHLDEPFLTQYWIWAKQVAQLDFGKSIQTTAPVTDAIKARLPLSLFLGVYAFLLTMIFGIAVGIAAALKRRTAVDRAVVGASVIGLSAPAFVSGVLLLYLFAVVLPWFPAYGRGAGFIDELWHLTLPAFALALTGTALIVKHTRAAMISVLDQDYVTFARARGLGWWRILLLYGLRNALIPVVTVSAVILTYVITGAVLVEVTFSLPGIGSLLVQSATTKDLPMLQGVAMLIAAVIVGANLLTDLLYAAVNPQVRLGGRKS